MALNGNIILVQLDGHTIAGTKTTEIQVDSELIEIASATQGNYREYLTGRKQWQVTVNYLLMYATYQTTQRHGHPAHLQDNRHPRQSDTRHIHLRGQWRTHGRIITNLKI